MAKSQFSEEVEEYFFHDSDPPDILRLITVIEQQQQGTRVKRPNRTPGKEPETRVTSMLTHEQSCKWASEPNIQNARITQGTEVSTIGLSLNMDNKEQLKYDAADYSPRLHFSRHHNKTFTYNRDDPITKTDPP